MEALKLNSQQQLRLNRTIQAGLDRTAGTLKRLLGGDVRLNLTAAEATLSDITVSFELRGALTGGLFVSLPENTATEIVKTLTMQADLPLLDERARSALMEFGNILASAFVGHFDQNQGLRTLPSPPELSLVPLSPPEFDQLLSADLSLSRNYPRAQVFIGLQREALDILLAG